MKSNTDKLALNLTEAAKLAGVSYPTILQWVNKNGFPAFRSGKRWIIPRNSFMEWLDSQAQSHAVI